MTLEAGQLGNPRKISDAYFSYVLMRLLMDPSTLPPVRLPERPLTPESIPTAREPEREHRTLALFIFVIYLNDSFWNRVGEESVGPWTKVLRAIRIRLGSGFSDRLVGATACAFVRDPGKNPAQQRDAYFVARLQTADRLIDSESGHWPVIAEVLRVYGAGGLSDIEGE